jgi:hypothetical protein
MTTNTTHNTNTLPTLSRPVVRVLKAIRDGASWRASHDTVEVIVANGLAHFVDLDESCDTGRPVGWTMTEAGRAALVGR